jgi:hypothetical protein
VDEKKLDEREQKLERLRTLLVEMLMAFRREYLQTTGCNRLEHWRILLDRMQAAARSSRNADEWATQVAKSLQIQQLGKYACQSLIELSSFVREQDLWPDARRLVDRERGLLEALGRRIAEERKEARETAEEAAT